MAGMQYQEKTAQENLQHPVMGAVFRAEIRKKNTKRKQMQHIVEKENGGLRK